ncbi:LysR family transcriptional regulator [Bacillus sp. JJ1532]|uniref:LysR family transcriptional regulator n=1 Tax=Bacillus sp. JJ1532 TaxID=3122958 RepID=UPI0030006D1A
MDSIGIESFLAVVRHGSLTDAANSLFISQSTLSHRLLQLEKSIGISLIDRGRGIRSLSLTADGEEFLKIARKWEDLIQETKLLGESTKKQKLTIGAVDSIHTYIMPPVYYALHQHSDSIELRLRTHQGVELYSLLEQGKIDIAFALFEKPMPDMIIKKFFSEPMVVVRKKQSSLALNNTIDFQSLNMSDQLYIDWSPSFRAWFDRTREEKEFSGIRVDSAGHLLTLLEIPGKWAIVPLSIANHFVTVGNFSIYYLEDPPPERVCYHIRPRYPRARASESLQILDSYLSLINDPLSALLK